MKKFIVKKIETPKPKYATFDIRVTKTQDMAFKDWCRKNRIIMTETFSKCVEGLDKYPSQIISNPTKNAKYGNIGIRGSVKDKKVLIAYCKENGVVIGDVVFSIINELMDNELVSCDKW